MGLVPYHIGITAAFVEEPYDADEPIYVPHVPLFTTANPTLYTVLRVKLNIYGTPNAPKRYVQIIRKHILTEDYKFLYADINVYTKPVRQ